MKDLAKATMNPGYAGRTQLLESVKALFRPVVVIVPDLQQICEIMLFSEGFLMAKVCVWVWVCVGGWGGWVGGWVCVCGVVCMCRNEISNCKARCTYQWYLKTMKGSIVCTSSIIRDM